MHGFPPEILSRVARNAACNYASDEKKESNAEKVLGKQAEDTAVNNQDDVNNLERINNVALADDGFW
ncbi:MAG: hypothetical protein OEN22_08575, partial [Gammaproteobacteria bacterium]|nr:hypothetical protein [Gammaproteobacteria bacterium]